jgi:hypothetical protein
VTRLTRAIATGALVGGVAFWVPSVFLHGAISCNSDLTVARLSTFLLPTTTCIAFAALVFRKRLALSPLGVAASMLCGVWLLGSGPMVISATFCGGGFRAGVPSALALIALGVLPPYAFIMATYDGSLGALIVTTLALLLAWVPCNIIDTVREKRRAAQR